MSSMVAAPSAISTTSFLKTLAGNYTQAEYAIVRSRNTLIGMYSPDEIDQVKGVPDLYLRVNPMETPGKNAKGNQSNGGKEYLTAVSAFGLDLDCDAKGGNYPPVSVLDEVLTQKSKLRFGVVVDSGSGGRHAYLLLSENAVGSPARYERAIKAIEQHIQDCLDTYDSGYAVDNGASAARLLRLPGSTHPKTGRVVEVISATGKRYSLSEIETELGLGEVVEKTFDGGSSEASEWVDQYLDLLGLRDVLDVFAVFGWQIDGDYVTHPGSKSGFHSGVRFVGANGKDGVSIWSSGTGIFEEGKWYSRAAAYVIFQFGGNWSKAFYEAEKAVCEPGYEFDDLPPIEPVSFSIAQAAGQTDTANAQRFADLFDREVLFVPPWKKWLSWDGSRWADDSGTGVQQRAVRYATSLWDCLPALSMKLSRIEFNAATMFIRASNQSNKIASFLKLAQCRENIVCPVDDLNSDPMLLNCVNGTVDLTTGQLRPHNPADRLTQITTVAFDPDAKCPRWEETLSLIFDNDVELIGYVQRLLGYSLSGATGEHVLPIAYGSGFNGKSTVWNVVAELLGDYASLANEELLLGDKNNHPTEKAALYQKRFVAISEPAQGSKLKESRVKELTGDRMITARRMNEDFWSFERTHTFWLSSNHLPRISGTDEGIWRRIKLIPFTVNLRDKVEPIADFDRWLIKHEGRGILAWLVRGFLDYQKHGLTDPACVVAATEKYREGSDVLGDFLAEHTVVEVNAQALASELYAAYVEWGGKWSSTAFGNEMGERFEKTKSRLRDETRGKTVYRGLRMRSEFE